MFGKKSILQIAQAKLDEAEMKLLEAQDALDYARTEVEYRSSQATRLRGFIADRMAEGETAKKPFLAYFVEKPSDPSNQS